jgi:hypothetical protein
VRSANGNAIALWWSIAPFDRRHAGARDRAGQAAGDEVLERVLGVLLAVLRLCRGI